MNAPRVWDKNKEKMYHPKDIARFYFTEGELYEIGLWNGDILLEGEFMALRPTGLPDKDGTEIFEEDIIETSTKRWSRRGKVVFKNGGFVLEFYEPLEHCHLVYFTKNSKVIGNFCKNPELMDFKPLKQKGGNNENNCDRSTC